MPVPRWFLGFDSAMEIISSVISIIIGYYAFKSYRLTKEKTLLSLHFSFTLLGAGLLVHGLTTYMTLIMLTPQILMLLNFGYTIYFATELLAYGLLAYAYFQQTRKLASTSVLTGMLPLRDYNPISETTIFFLLAYITLQCATNYSAKRKTTSLLVLTGFALLGISHLLFLLAHIRGLFFVFGHVAQLGGFLCLLTMLLQVSRGT